MPKKQVNKTYDMSDCYSYNDNSCWGKKNKQEDGVASVQFFKRTFGDSLTEKKIREADLRQVRERCTNFRPKCFG